jgi:hypothetical protein
MLLHASRRLYSMSGGKVRTLQARSGAESMSDFALSSEHFSFLSEKLSLFYQNLVSIHARD